MRRGCGSEALAGGPIGKLVDGDTLEIVIDRRRRPLLAERPHAGLSRTTRSPTTRGSGRRCSGRAEALGRPCVYFVDRSLEVMASGLSALERPR